MARRFDTMDKKRVRAETHAGKIMTPMQEVADAATLVTAACGTTERGANEGHEVCVALCGWDWLDCGFLSVGSTPLMVAEDRPTGMIFAVAVSMVGGGDPHSARLLAEWYR